MIEIRRDHTRHRVQNVRQWKRQPFQAITRSRIGAARPTSCDMDSPAGVIEQRFMPKHIEAIVDYPSSLPKRFPMGRSSTSTASDVTAAVTAREYIARPAAVPKAAVNQTVLV